MCSKFRYVKIFSNNRQPEVTRIVKKNLDPVFNGPLPSISICNNSEEFAIGVPQIILEVWDWDKVQRHLFAFLDNFSLDQMTSWAG